MNLGILLKAFDTVIVLRDAAKRLKGGQPPVPETGMTAQSAASGVVGQLETRLTNVVVAALKEAFDRDHARLELERAQLEEQRRRAEEAMRMELRRQTADRELARLRMLAVTALVGWSAAVALLLARVDMATVTARGLLAAGWILLLAALGAAFSAQARVSATVRDAHGPQEQTAAGAAALWLLVAGLAMSAVSLLF